MKRPGNRFFPIFMKVQNLSFKFIIFSEKEFNFSSEAFDYMKIVWGPVLISRSVLDFLNKPFQAQIVAPILVFQGPRQVQLDGDKVLQMPGKLGIAHQDHVRVGHCLAYSTLYSRECLCLKIMRRKLLTRCLWSRTTWSRTRKTWRWMSGLVLLWRRFLRRRTNNDSLLCLCSVQFNLQVAHALKYLPTWLLSCLCISQN